MLSYFGCWLYLSDKDNNVLSPIIKDLSSKFDKGDTFPPHISLSASKRLELKRAIKAVNDCSKGIKKFKVEKIDVRYSERWSKTLFIQLKGHPNLTNMSKFLEKTFANKGHKYILNPHISLMYNDKIDTKTKLQLSKSVFVPDKFLVSKITVVTPGTDNNWKDYGNWKVVYEKELG